ncbi:HIT family protein [Litorivivens sp.]|uniref:HIT family protein n=1 Tax=Litorivivens sp. TaxID=2020868 RepID=UPI003565BE81
MASECIFCQIAAGNAPAHIVYTDKQLIAFLDLFPAHRGHTLIIPKRHSDDIFTADSDDIAAVGRLSVPLARVLERITGADGLGVHQLNRAAAGQTVFHYHQHLIPQTAGEPLAIHGRKMGEQAELAALAAHIQQELRAEMSG